MWLIFLIKATEEVKIHYVTGNITSAYRGHWEVLGLSLLLR